MKKLHPTDSYASLLAGVDQLLDAARRRAAQSVNAILTATYWRIGRRIVEFEQGGRTRAVYGESLLKKLSHDLTRRHGRGFSERNLEQMRLFYLAWPISQTPSAKSDQPPPFPLSWSHYVLLLSLDDPGALSFYGEQALRGGRPEGRRI